MSHPILNHQRRKDRDMYDMYTKLSEVRENGISKYSHQWIMGKLSERFYLEPDTITSRIKSYARNRNTISNQLSIELPM